VVSLQSQANKFSLSAYILHSKNYQESSQILQIFSLQQGRLSVIAKGIKSKRSQARKALLQPFKALKLELTGKSDLKTLIDVELCQLTQSSADPTISNPLASNLQGKPLAAAYYANELLIRACPERQEFSYLFQAYQQLLQQLKQAQQESLTFIAPALREFEVSLLSEMGIAPDWYADTEDNDIDPEGFYRLQAEHGFERCQQAINPRQGKAVVFVGHAILALANGQYLPQYAKASQQITAHYLSEIIGNRPLQSRKMWQSLSLS
jgi:DNA repair protein RecO (recombination protein O)